MTDQSLNKLFEKARVEPPQTDMKDVQKWIGYTGVFALLAGFSFKFKTIFTSKIILMTSSIILAASVAVGTIIFSVSNNKAITNKKDAELIRQDLQREVTLLPVITSTPEQSSSTPAAIIDSTETHQNESFVLSLLPLRQFASLSSNADSIDLVRPAATPDKYGTFNAIKVSGAIDVVLIQGNECGVRIDADAVGEKVVRIINEGGTLKIYSENKSNNSNYELTVYVTFKELKKIDCSGASEIKSQGELILENLLVKVSGASEIELALKTKDLTLESSGASEIELTGQTDVFTLNNSGASELEAKNFKVKRAEIVCSSASETTVSVSEHLKADISGASEVKYFGNPTVEKQVTGVSSIKRI